MRSYNSRHAIKAATKSLQVAATLLIVAAMHSACGYTLGSPRLPGNASRLALAPIRNRTLTGEVDVRLGHELRQLLLRHPGIVLTDINSSELIMDIEITYMQVLRVRDLEAVNVSNITYSMYGLVSLYDRRAHRYSFSRVPVSSFAHQDFDSPVTETPAVRDEGLNIAVNSFAQRIETVLFTSF
jgi:hypothetical protein